MGVLVYLYFFTENILSAPAFAEGLVVLFPRSARRTPVGSTLKKKSCWRDNYLLCSSHITAWRSADARLHRLISASLAFFRLPSDPETRERVEKISLPRYNEDTFRVFFTVFPRLWDCITGFLA